MNKGRTTSTSKMAVSLESKCKTSTSAWTSIFPTEQVTSVSESIKFMKKFAAVGVSTILYLRTNLPDDTFDVKNVDGMRVSIMKPAHGVAKAMCSGITNGMKALKDGHLRELHVLFYPTKVRFKISTVIKIPRELQSLLRDAARVKNPGGAGSTVVGIISPPWLR